MEESGARWRTRAAKLFCALVGAVALWWILKRAAGILVILGIAWAVAAVIDPLARRTEARFKLPRKLCAAVYVLLLLTVFGGLAVFLISRLTEELRELVAWMGENRALIGEKIGAALDSVSRLSSYLPFMDPAAQSGGADAAISGMLQKTASELGALLTVGAGKLLGGMPKWLILAVITVMSCFYLSMDYVRIRDFAFSLLPPRYARQAEGFRARVGRTALRYLRAYGILWMLTLGEVLIGLWILKQPYAFLIALAVATVDLLPVVGAGTVLVPWAVILFLLGRPSVGIGLLILYGVVTIVRQIAEPYLVGESLGIHPLASLLCMAFGLQLFGVAGILLGPIAALLIKEYLAERKRQKMGSASE